MQFTVAYRGHSGVTSGPGGTTLAFAPNLRRDRVAFGGDLRDPLRFREAASTLHAVVVGDLKRKPKDRSAYQAYLQRVAERERTIRRLATGTARTVLEAEVAKAPPAGLAASFQRLRSQYWDARVRYSDYLIKNDPALWRVLTPCDPVVTVAPDCVFFECFSKDESSYGCLTVDRDGFAGADDAALGTTNVDYSLGLYEEFQRLRTYRRARFSVDPDGFGVSTAVGAEYREEKIDLPPAWLRGFMQLQAAMALPTRRVSVGRDGLYAVLAKLARRRPLTSPRALRFELTPGRPATLVLEPWEQRIELQGEPYQGAVGETIRVWGRDRLKVLARLLPYADGVDAHLLGTGLPSFWSVRLGPMRFLLGLSGWTANDWTSGGGALADLQPPVEPSEDVLGDIADCFRASPALTFDQVRQRTGATPALVAAGLNRFALLGQLVRDLAGGVYRWRSILPVEAALSQVKIDSPEAEAGMTIAARGWVKLDRNETVSGVRVLTGRADGKTVEAVIDGDGRIVRGQCQCSHYYRFKLKAGPCRHMIALRRAADGTATVGTLESWFRAMAGV